MSCSTLKRLADSKLKNVYADQTCYFKNGVLSGLFCESLTSMADQLLELCSEYMCLLLCVRFKPCIKILCVASKIFCYSRVHFMLTIKGETGWCYISCVSLVNTSQLLFTFVPAQIETHQSCKPWPRIWSLMHSINCRILFSTRKKRAVTFQIKICPFRLILSLFKKQNAVSSEEKKLFLSGCGFVEIKCSYISVTIAIDNF